MEAGSLGILRDVREALIQLPGINEADRNRSAVGAFQVVYCRFASHLRHLPAFHAEQAYFNYSLRDGS